MHRATWSEIVDACDGIRRFEFGVPGFETTLDHTTGCNEHGYPNHARTYLDGVFGFLVHFGGSHALAIGFSVSGDRSILLQQIQTTGRRGNRWLYRLPTGCVPHAIDRMRAAFPDHRVLLADGADVARQNLESYDGSLRRIERDLEQATRHRSWFDDADAYIERRRADYRELHARRQHLAKELPRLAALYRSTGPYALGGAQGRRAAPLRGSGRLGPTVVARTHRHEKGTSEHGTKHQDAPEDARDTRAHARAAETPGGSRTTGGAKTDGRTRPQRGHLRGRVRDARNGIAHDAPLKKGNTDMATRHGLTGIITLTGSKRLERHVTMTCEKPYPHEAQLTVQATATQDRDEALTEALAPFLANGAAVTVNATIEDGSMHATTDDMTPAERRE